MCGRLSRVFNDFTLNYHQHLRDFVDLIDRWEADYNIAPMTYQDLRCSDGDKTYLKSARWGLVPSWSKDGKGFQINARAETVHEKSFFKQAFQKRRCLTLATGYYEWQTVGKSKLPYHIHFVDNRPFFLYSVWQGWTDPASKESVTTFATMTTEPNDDLSFVHDRMPCIAEVDDQQSLELWMNHTDEDYEARHKLLGPFQGKLVATPVSSYVNNTRNQGPKCIEPAENNLLF